MPETVNRQILMATRPEGAPLESDFEMVEAAVPTPGDGQVLCQTIYLSLDPYMRGRMSAAKSYAKGVEVGEVMVGGAVSEVADSRHPNFRPGDSLPSGSGFPNSPRPGFPGSSTPGSSRFPGSSRPGSSHPGFGGSPNPASKSTILDGQVNTAATPRTPF